MYAGRIVEKAGLFDAFASLGASVHAWAAALRAPLRRRAARADPGRPANMLRPPSGCAFQVRCPYAIDECADGIPTLRPVGPVETACHQAEHLVAEALL